MKEKASEFLRFIIVGVAATAIHYGLYLFFQIFMLVSLAYSLGYAISLVCNFIMTSKFTFKSKASVLKGAGFIGSHIVNYCMHILLLNLFLFIGLRKEIAPIPVFCFVVPLNFILVRFVFRKLK